ncbi:MAG: SAM-dependent methyltransferase, partial [bacterium]
RGHFSTAPHLSPTFRGAVGRLLTELVDASLAASASGTISEGEGEAGDRSPVAVVELGGGEGDLAAAVLEGWQRTHPDLLEKVVYTIVEIGEPLRALQREAVSGMVARGWKVGWADDLEEAAAGARPAVIVGNEFVDALPVHVIDVRGEQPLEAWVVDEEGSGRVTEHWGDLSPEVESELGLLFGGAECEHLRCASRDGFIELRPAARSLLRQIAVVMPAGCLLTIDYGGWFPRVAAEEADEAGEGGATGCARPCGLPSKPVHGRTLRGYFRHQLVADLYARVGHQDLTADVDFRALDAHGREAGFETVLYTSVAALLHAGGGEEELHALRMGAGESLDADREATVLEALMDEEGLGGSFKVMLQVRE